MKKTLAVSQNKHCSDNYIQIIQSFSQTNVTNKQYALHFLFLSNNECPCCILVSNYKHLVFEYRTHPSRNLRRKRARHPTPSFIHQVYSFTTEISACYEPLFLLIIIAGEVWSYFIHSGPFHAILFSPNWEN